MKVLAVFSFLTALSCVAAFMFDTKEKQCARECKGKQIDVVFVVDGSEDAKFHRSKSKIVNFLKPFAPESFQHQLRVHLVRFGGNLDFKADLIRYNICSQANSSGCESFEAFTAKIMKVKKLGGQPHWGDAFHGINLLQMRPDSTKVLVTVMGNWIKNEEDFIEWNIVDNLKRFDFFYQLFVGTKLPLHAGHTCDGNCFHVNEGSEKLHNAASMMARDVCCSYVAPKCLKKCGSKPLDLVFVLIGDQVDERKMDNQMNVVRRSLDQLKVDEAFHQVHVEVAQVDARRNHSEHLRMKIVSDVCSRAILPHEQEGCEELGELKRKLKYLYSPLDETDLKPALDFARNESNFQFRENSQKVLVVVFDGVPRDFNYSAYAEDQLRRDVEGLDSVFDHKQAWFINMASRGKRVEGFECSHFTNGYNFAKAMNQLRSLVGCPNDQNHESCTNQTGCRNLDLPTFEGGSMFYNLGWYDVGESVYIKCDEGRKPRRKYGANYSICQPDGTFKPKHLKCVKK